MLFAQQPKSNPPLFLWLVAAAVSIAAQDATSISWRDLPPSIQGRLERGGLDRDQFPAWTAALRDRHAARVREGDEDHLVFYALQSSGFTSDPPIEPATSARALLAGLNDAARQRFVDDPRALDADRIPEDARRRLDALVRAAEANTDNPRLSYLRALLQVPSQRPPTAWRMAAERRVRQAYVRSMRFLVEQERAGHARDAASAVAELYRTRGLSTDTSVEAGFLVREGLATLHAIDAKRRLQRVVIVGPGFDLAPRTGYRENVPPQSLQPLAVIDALVSLGMADLPSLRVSCLDINPRVVEALQRMKRLGAPLTIAPGLANTAGLTLSDGFRSYVDEVGLAVHAPAPLEPQPPFRRVAVAPAALATIEPIALDIVLDRLALDADLVVVTNVLPYFDDRELSLALANVAAMLTPGGILLHNEARPEVGAITAAAGLPLVQSRSAILATVRDGPPLYDSVFIHRRQ